MNSVRVHRVNFFEPDPKAIRCLAFDNSILRLAVSRADASIEVWDVTKNPYLEKFIPGIPDSSVETLAWCNGRLFSAGLYGYIHEYDLKKLIVKFQVLATSGCPILCMAVNRQKSSLAIGNEDGHVVLYDFSQEGLDFLKKFDKQEGSILCLAWHKDGHIIVTGSTDTIRVWNVENGHVINRIIPGRVSKNTSTIVWCISVTSDMTIISGDSSGKTSFWDGNTGTLISSVAVHKGDVLTVCLKEDESEIYTSGVDPIIQSFMKSQSNDKWLKSIQRIVHTHDVRALALVGDFLASGGDDCSLVFTKYPPNTTVKYFPFCQKAYSNVSSLASCILLQYPFYLELYRIGEASPGSYNNYKKMLQIKAKANEVIICSSISADAKWLAYSSQLQLKLFNIHMEDDSVDPPSIFKVLLPDDDFPQTASLLSFSLNLVKLFVYSEGKIYVLQCDKDDPHLEGIIEEEPDLAGQTHLMELSNNGTYLACGSHDGNVTIYDLKSLKVFCKLPLYKYQPTCLSFDPTSEYLVVAYTDRKVVEYSLKERSYTSWSKQALQNLQDVSFYPINSIIYNEDRLYFQDENSIYIFNKTDESQPDKKKMKKSEHSSISFGDDSFKTITKYEHISQIHAFKNDIVIVQIPADHIEDSLPPPIWKKKYGT